MIWFADLSKNSELQVWPVQIVPWNFSMQKFGMMLLPYLLKHCKCCHYSWIKQGGYIIWKSTKRRNVSIQHVNTNYTFVNHYLNSIWQRYAELILFWFFFFLIPNETSEIFPLFCLEKKMTSEESTVYLSLDNKIK